MKTLECKTCHRSVVIARMAEIEPAHMGEDGHWVSPYCNPEIWEPGGDVIIAMCMAGPNDVAIEVECDGKGGGHTITPQECSECGYELSIDEATWYPSRRGDYVYCGSCYSDLFEFVCARCDCESPIEEMDEIGRVFVVPHSAGLAEPGVYRINAYPYFWDNMFSQGLFRFAVDRLCGYPHSDPLKIEDEAVAVFLCGECRAEVVSEIEEGRETPWVMMDERGAMLLREIEG